MLLGAFGRVNNWVMINNEMNDQQQLEAIDINRMHNIKFMNLENNYIKSMSRILRLG